MIRRDHPHCLWTSAVTTPPRHRHPARGRPGLLQVRGHWRELRRIPTPRESRREPFPLPWSRQVYKPLIPSYKHCSPCQGSSGTCCHSRGWKAAPASVCGYRTSCSGLGADGRMAHLTGSRPSKDEGGGRVCVQHGQPQFPAMQRRSKCTHLSLSAALQVVRRDFHTRVNLDRCH